MLALVCSLLLSCGHSQLSGERGTVPNKFQTKLAKQVSDIPKSVRKARAVHEKLYPLLRKYSGGMPTGFLAAIASFESGGKMSSTGDASLGEIGIFQITRTFPAKVGLSPESRRSKENNVFFGGIEYQIMAAEMFLANPKIRLGTPDNWKLARLAFSIGPSGTRKLMEKSGAKSWGDLVRFVDSTGGISLGRQTAGKVWFRVKVIDVLWDIGLQVNRPLFVGSPLRVPNPPAGAYTLPSHVSGLIPSRWQGPLVVAASAGLYYAARKIL